MNYKKCLGAASAALMMVIAITLVLAPCAWAQSSYKNLHTFKSAPGGQNVGNMLLDAVGNLYGWTYVGGAYGDGTVFELTPNADGSWTKQTLHSFNGDDGRGPAGLIFDTAGNLYGTTQYGGEDGGCATVFKLTHNSNGTWTESVLHSFTGGDGCDILGSLVFDTVGNLYGTAAEGGSGGWGTVFQLMPNSDGTWTEHTLCNFTLGSDGGYPWGTRLTLDAAGNLYGVTTYGGLPGCDPAGRGCFGLGVVFELTPNSDGTWTEHVLHTFTGKKDGANPDSSLVFDAAGNLYGTATYGGLRSYCSGYGCGVVFELTPNSNGGWTEEVLHSFSGKDGANPFAGVIFDAGGNLYGTVPAGGAHGYGIVFKLAPNSKGGWGETVLHTFIDQPGADPYAGVIFDAVGNLYGATWGDGTKTFGSVFEITP